MGRANGGGRGDAGGEMPRPAEGRARPQVSRQSHQAAAPNLTSRGGLPAFPSSLERDEHLSRKLCLTKRKLPAPCRPWSRARAPGPGPAHSAAAAGRWSLHGQVVGTLPFEANVSLLCFTGALSTRVLSREPEPRSLFCPQSLQWVSRPHPLHKGPRSFRPCWGVRGRLLLSPQEGEPLC